MKIFLAGCEAYKFAQLNEIANNRYALFSYYHFCKTSPNDRVKMSELFARFPQELICDSGLFTMMFGAGKGGSYDLKFMRDYTKTYLKWASDIAHPDITFVESDVHKLLGMDAVFELRKQFEDSGLKHMYVWHREEGLDGLYKMAERYDYIAISVPELRILCKGKKIRYQDAVKDLERKIVCNVSRVPKIHLLGNTVMETMNTNISYSCDSTSWLSGGRYGVFYNFKNGQLKSKRLDTIEYRKAKFLLETQYGSQYNKLLDQYGDRSKCLLYMIAMYLSARSFNLYQQVLDRKFRCIEGVSNGNKR